MKLTRTQQKYFEEYCHDMLVMVFADSGIDSVTVDRLMGLIDIKEYAKNFGSAVLEKCSFNDLKAADRAYKDPAVIRASIAVEEAIAKTMPSTSDVKNIQFMAGYLTSGVYKDDQFLNVLSETSEAVQEQAVKELHGKV